MFLLPTLVLLAAQFQGVGRGGSETDTTIAVAAGTRLKLENQGGDIVIHAWEKNQVRIQASHSRRTRVEVRHSGAVLSLEADAEHGPANMVDYELTVPSWMPLDLGGMYATVTIDGSKAPITVQTLEGDIDVKGGAESVKLSTTTGKLVVSGARGRIELNSVSEDIEGSDLQGDIHAETVSGDISLRRVDAKSVEVEAVSGDLTYEGRIVDGGSYSFLTHSGDISVSIPEGANATISTAVGSGDVRASFTLPASERPSRRRQTYRLGNGSATVELETFSGDVRLMRPAEIGEQLDRKLKERREKEEEKALHKRRIKPDHDGDRDGGDVPAGR
jgi:DUF4097 and DUF4098 domain-containing protein YvlB